MNHQKTVLFVTGMPRSGTKLFRKLLNNNQNISIPESETLIIPKLLREYGDRELSLEELNDVYQQILSSKFYLNLNSDFPGYNLMESVAYSATISDVIIDLLSFFGKNQNAKVIGDKTPGYLMHIDLLLKHFKNAKVIHIVRDPRDCSYSVAHAWGRSYLRAADRWKRGVECVRKSKCINNENFLLIHFEELLENPQKKLTKVCDFIGVEFNEEMINLQKSTENLGEAKGYIGIKQDNKNKFKTKFTNKQLRKIESIVKPELLYYGYKLENDVEYKPLNYVQRKLLKLYDGIKSIHFHITEKGLKKGVIYFLKVHRQNSTRGVLE
ncbi:MAG: sulfotransferase [Balneola sp.]